MAEVTFYIPCYNAASHVEHSIRALLNQTRPPDELIVIDDGSTDNTADIAARFPVRVIRHKENKGLAAARNTAFANARHELVGGIDADVFPAKEWIEQLLRNLTDEQVAGASGRLIENFRELPADAWRALHMSQDLGEERIEIEWPSNRRLGGFGTILRKGVVQSVGGYNERYRTNYEDVDLCERVLRAGYKLVSDPRAVAYHQRRDSIKSVLRTKWNWEFWFHYFQGGYNRIWLKLLLNFRYGRALAWMDIRSGRFSLLPIDLLLPWQHSFLDIRYYLSPKRMPNIEPEPRLSGPYVPRPFRRFCRAREGPR